jgi:UDP-N-acetylmuramoyl-tripeptide--D-alanyl-D-alanine ligase
MTLTLSQIIEATAATANFGTGSPCPPETPVSGWSIDSRTIEDGELFIALRGDNHDGHQYLSAAFERGAIAALVSEIPAASVGPVLLVPDSLKALQTLSVWARDHWNGTIAGVTGSAGKTSTKDIIAECLSARFRVGKTIGNFNNHIGLPLSILRLPDTAQVAVLEMGMNHAGEIRDLARIARPKVGVVTNVGYAHVEAFESIEGVAAAKRELISELPDDGIAILNADDERVRRFADVHQGRSILYGFDGAAEVRVVDYQWDSAGAEFSVGGVRFTTSLPGRHSVLNIAAGLATAGAFGIGLTELQPVVASLRPGKMRGERIEREGIVILNDSYNSNPEAARSMIDVLVREPAQRRIAVLGEMLELGSMAEMLHRSVGAYVARAGIDYLIGVGQGSRWMIDEAIKDGFRSDSARFFPQAEEAGQYLQNLLEPGDAVLFKGSRGTHVERALAALQQ